MQIGALTRLIYHAVHKQETDAARQLRDTARLQLPRCEGQALEHLQRAIDHANDWIRLPTDPAPPGRIRQANTQTGESLHDRGRVDVLLSPVMCSRRFFRLRLRA
ncbi:hypothetical protein ACWC9Q_35005 [Streptomyces sp. NPDC001142]